MTTIPNLFISGRQALVVSAILGSLSIIQSCKTEQKQTKNNADLADRENVIEIVTRNMDFQMQDTIPSGWNTFRYKNQSPQTHFFMVDKYPEGKTSEDAEKLVAPVFDSAMKLLTEGKTEEGYAQFGNLPEWYAEVVIHGGSGLVSPGQVAETTLKLAPGKYILECYVKMSNGTFHTSMGMTKDLVVSAANSGNEALKADIDISISSSDGIEFNDTIPSGKKTFSVFFKDQIVHENFVGHDINLVKLDENTDLDNLENWMNWADPKGLIEPAPSDVTFLGGVNDMPAGSMGFFSVALTQGRYALISEVPNTREKNMLKIFTITD